MRHVVRILLFALVSVLIPLTMLKYVDWIAAAIAAVANWIVFTVTWNAARIVDIELVRVNPDPKLVRLYLVYAILSIAALCSAALYGVEPTWAVYGVGAALGTFGVLLGGWSLRVTADFIPFLLVTYVIAMLWFTWPLIYVLPLVITGMAMYGALHDGRKVDVIATAVATVLYLVLLFYSLGSNLFAPVIVYGSVVDTSTSSNLVAEVVSLLIFFTIVGICEELSSRALIPLVGSATAAVFVLLHIPSRFYGLLLPTILDTGNITDVCAAAVLYVSSMLYLMAPTYILTAVALRHGLVSAMLMHALFDTLVSIPSTIATITLLVTGIVYLVARRREM